MSNERESSAQLFAAIGGGGMALFILVGLLLGEVYEFVPDFTDESKTTRESLLGALAIVLLCGGSAVAGYKIGKLKDEGFFSELVSRFLRARS